MKRGLKVTKEQVFVSIIGFFVGRAVCFEMNPLAAAFWAAAQIEGLGSMWLFVAMLLGVLSAQSLAGGITFTLFAFLFFISCRAFRMRRRKGIQNRQAEGGEEASPAQAESEQEEMAAVSGFGQTQALEQGSWVRLSVLAGFCLLATQMLGWTITGSTLDNGLISSHAGGIRYIWSNQRMTILAVLEAALEGVITGCLSFLLLSGLSRKEWQLIQAGGSNRKIFIAGCLVLAIVLYGLPGSMYATFAIAESVCYLAILCVAYVYGTLESTLVGALGGAVLAYQLQDFSVLGLVTLFGVAAGLLREMGRLGVFMGMAMIALAVEFGVDGTTLASNSLKGLVTSGVIFLFLPKSFLQQKNVEETAVMDLMQEQLGRTVREKMRDFAGGFFKLQHGLMNLPKPAGAFDEQDISTMYMQMKENVCDQCEGRFRCYNVNPEQTYGAAKSIFLALDEKGGISKEDIPKEFADVCNNQEAFMVGANLSFERAKSNRIVQQKLAESREMLANQVGDVALMMNEFSSELVQDCGRDESMEMLLRLRLKTRQVQVKQVLFWKREHEPDVLYVVAQCWVGALMTAREMAAHISAVYHKHYRPSESCKAVITKNYEVYSFVEDPAFHVVKGIQRLAMEGRTNGDNFSYMNLEDGRFVAMLSDGMGTGQRAYDVSATLIELLEEFLEAGFAQEMALKLANSVLALNFDNSAYATLDFFSMNLFTGVGRLVKIGAVATFIKRGEQVETIVSTSLPAGVFSEMDCDAVEVKMQDGDLVVMVSDGVMDAVIVEEKEEYIKDVLADMDTSSPQMVADELLNKIQEKGMSRIKDDMTVMAFSVWKKG